MTKKEPSDFDDWFADTFSKYVYASGKRFLEPYYSIAQIATRAGETAQ